MRSTTIAIAIMGSVVAAENAVTTLWLPGFDTQPLVASIVGGDATATTYAIECAPGTEADECGVGMGFTLIEGPSTAVLNMVDVVSASYWVNLNCDLNRSASQATCTEADGGAEDTDPQTTSTVLGPDEFTSYWMPVTITAGSVSGVPATAAASATAGTASATGSTGSASSTATSTGTSAASSATSSGLSTAASSIKSAESSVESAASSKASSVSTGGMPQITGNAQWAVGGAAVAFALAAL